MTALKIYYSLSKAHLIHIKYYKVNETFWIDRNWSSGQTILKFPLALQMDIKLNNSKSVKWVWVLNFRQWCTCFHKGQNTSTCQANNKFLK